MPYSATIYVAASKSTSVVSHCRNKKRASKGTSEPSNDIVRVSALPRRSGLTQHPDWRSGKPGKSTTLALHKPSRSRSATARDLSEGFPRSVRHGYCLQAQFSSWDLNSKIRIFIFFPSIELTRDNHILNFHTGTDKLSACKLIKAKQLWPDAEDP